MYEIFLFIPRLILCLECGVSSFFKTKFKTFVNSNLLSIPLQIQGKSFQTGKSLAFC